MGLSFDSKEAPPVPPACLDVPVSLSGLRCSYTGQAAFEAHNKEKLGRILYFPIYNPLPSHTICRPFPPYPSGRSCPLPSWFFRQILLSWKKEAQRL